MTTIDIILLGAVTTLAGKIIYDTIKGGHRPKESVQNRDLRDILAVNKQNILKLTECMARVDKQIDTVKEHLDYGVRIAEKNSDAFQTLVLAINDLSNTNKNVLVAVKEQTGILTKILMNGKGV